MATQYGGLSNRATFDFYAWAFLSRQTPTGVDVGRLYHAEVAHHFFHQAAQEMIRSFFAMQSNDLASATDAVRTFLGSLYWKTAYHANLLHMTEPQARKLADKVISDINCREIVNSINKEPN